MFISINGDIADVAALATTCGSHGARLMVDDDHGLGVLGDNGDDCAERRLDADQVPILVGTLGKALGPVAPSLPAAMR
ncbi:aminotransferase class I/II-fold pyridoxal phosphate-dependent enzyme [Halomonas daqingensis]|uniref:Aminotransferase class I/II-fold pyridoxal phosphate-dependent enzyme n=1 Tax=Billgrantia desiderata TaxID=52021 RepID=A0ABS9B409_9GAMM|nr:aminotransferase class I/II-fold pyridoxal phosphate-dependent enzyme [Halomonas desiderata]MCE8046924.1 aminotransferase class I/II-fold pyridoxal phosphate-dependent enzyme [Halomonas desiderata]